MNRNSILFLVEGETEIEFYKKIFAQYVEPRKIKRNFANLEGVYNLNKKVKNKIESYLINKASSGLKKIHVFIAYDREGTRDTEPMLNIGLIRKQFLSDKSRIKSITEIIATQDLESWFFNDLDGIYSYLKVAKKQRSYKFEKNTEATHNRILSKLFHNHGKHYQKGKRAHNFIEHLNLDKIIKNTPELNDALIFISTLYNKS